MGNYWLNRHDRIKEMQGMLESQIQSYLFDPLDEYSKKKMEEQICNMLSKVWSSVEKLAELQLKH
jgi:hypothetical protein